MKNNKNLVLVSILFIFVAVIYSPLKNGFFQQDEWSAFGNVYGATGESFSRIISQSFAPNVGHYVPLHNLLFNLLFRLFGLNYLPWALISIVWHVSITFLVYLLSLKLFKKSIFALVATLFFGIAVSGYQATTWVGADINTHGAAFFGLLSLILLIDSLKKKVKNDWYFVFSLISLFTSLMFKEITVGLFLLIPFFIWLFSNKDFNKKKIYSAASLAAGVLYVGARVLMFFFPQASQASIVTQSQSLSKLIYNLGTFPAKSFIQTLVPVGNFSLLEKFLNIETYEYDLFIQEKVFEKVFVAAFILSLIGLLYLVRKYKKRFESKILIFSASFIVINSFIYAFSPGRTGIVTFIDSRNLYFVSVGTAILLASFISLIYYSKRKTLAIIVACLVVGLNVYWLQAEIGSIAKTGSIRKGILYKIRKLHSDLPQRVVFYTESDSSFYGLSDSERIMPFQSGFGQTLLVWYQEKENYPKEYFKDNFLWNITEEGYKEINNRGFGYFRDFDKLAQTVSKEGVPIGSIIAFRYGSKQQALEDITQEIRGRLKGYLINRKEIPFSVDSSTNPDNVWLMIDKDRKTYWGSKIPYIYPISVNLDMKTSRKIAQITIDSYNNKDQNAVGYRVSVSQDGQEWKEVFYSRRYPPNDGGIVNLYFEPTNGKFVKIEQTGEHKFAQWVIHEIKAYEAAN